MMSPVVNDLPSFRSLFQPQPWMRDGACVGTTETASFYPGRGQGAKEARRMCLLECPVLFECAVYGEFEKFGVWGGLTSSQRREARENGVSIIEAVMAAKSVLVETEVVLEAEPRQLCLF